MHSKSEGSKTWPVSAQQKQAIAAALNRKSYCQDTGQLDPRLAAAFSCSTLQRQLEEIVALLPQVRLLLPVYPHAASGSKNYPVTGKMFTGKHHKSQPGVAGVACPPGALLEVELAGNTSLRAVAAFSDLATLHSAYPDARPVPVQGRYLAMSVLQRPGRLLLNNQFLIPRPAVNAIVTGDDWVPAWKNQRLLTQLARIFEGEVGVRFLGLRPQLLGVDQILVGIDSRLESGKVSSLFTRLQMQLANLSGLAENTDGLVLTPMHWS